MSPLGFNQANMNTLQIFEIKGIQCRQFFTQVLEGLSNQMS